jgi:hypothetical protein
MDDDEQDSNLGDRLRDYFSVGAPDLDVHLIVQQTIAAQGHGGRGSSLRAWTGFGARIALGAGAVAAALWVGLSLAQLTPIGSSPPNGESLTPLVTQPPVPTSTASTISAWTEHVLESDARESVVHAVEFGNGRLVAVGALNSQPAIWTSNDGAAWQAAEGTPPVPPEAAGYLVDVVATSAGFAAVGWTSSPSVGESPLLWISSDGAAWLSAELAGIPPATRLTTVAAGPDRMVVVGSVADTPVMWVSGDGGASWEAAAPPEGALSIAGIVWMAERFVAIGTKAGSTSEPTVWASSDGVSWAVTAELPGGYVTAITVANDRLVAVGNDGGTRAVVWLSQDGLDWRVADMPPDTPELVAVAQGPRDIVSIGGGQSAPSTLWRSSSGEIWQADGEFAASVSGAIRGLAAANRNLVAVGDRGGVPFAWVETSD